MSKAGPLMRSRSLRPREEILDTSRHDSTSPSKESFQSVQPSQLRQDLGSRLHSEEMVIGLALGSPRENHFPLFPPEDRDADASYIPNSLDNRPFALGNVCEVDVGGKEMRRKGSRWKTFGSFFGKKDSSTRVAEAASFYQLDQTRQQGPLKQFITQNHLDTNSLRRKRADSGQGNREQALDPFHSRSRGPSNVLLRRNSSQRKGLQRRKVQELKPELQRLHGPLSAHAELQDSKPPSTKCTSDPCASRRRPPAVSLLEVEIPSVKLERYSVMFGNLLDPKPQPSLLARRQGHLEELKAVIDLQDKALIGTDHPKPHQRDKSISSTRSPLFSLFPSIPPLSARGTTNKQLPKPIPLSRSLTAPNTLSSPPRATIHKSKSQGQDHVFLIVHSPSPIDMPATPGSHGRKSSADSSHRSANSTQGSFFECPEYPGYLYPTEEINPPTPTRGAREAFLQRAFPVRKSSMKKLPLPQPQFCHEAKDSISTAAEVSIARQISISRRQRQLLVPIVPKIARRQPTLVNAQSTTASRKSHHLMLEDA